MSPLATVRHLTRRFLQSLRPAWPSAADQALVAEALGPDEASLFWAQPVADLAHALRVAHLVKDVDATLIPAALLHDIGKSVQPIGPIRRSVATVLAGLRLPMTPNLRSYIDHPAIGAALLERTTASDLTIAFAHHHRVATPPAGIDPEAWEALRRADQTA